ncbi:hypothetical protein ACFXDE_01995 [Kitasatospora sp. NPDC059408]|uniref:hypothetical protein n=1 Tax=Kitasatospora sp. NPDC059408 TaxID=3346823 RepID=UPI0036CE658C
MTADDLVPCTACLDEVPRHQIREYAGRPYCLDCLDGAEQQHDHALTWQLAYAA